MSDPDAEVDAAERWLDQLEDRDRPGPTVHGYNVEPLTAATRQVQDAVADALARGVPAHVINVFIEDLKDRLSVLLRTGKTISAPELREKLGIRTEADQG